MDKGTARVKFPDEDIVSNPLALSVPFSKDDQVSFPLAINTDVWVMLDESGAYGIIGGAVYNAKNKMQGNEDEIKVTINVGKLSIKLNRTNGNLEIESDGKVIIKADLDVEGKISATDNITSDAEVVAMDVKAGTTGAYVKLLTHVHPSTGAPPTPTP